MKIEFLAPILMLAAGVACNDNANDGSTSTSGGGGGDGGDVTPVGTSTGPVVPGMIGPAGGQLSSADGRLTLIVPAGALSAQTMFGIEPITNQAPQGIGTAYRLTPDGQTFSTPATVSFTYGDADVLGTNEQLLMIVYQDPAAHYWRMDADATVDATAKTVQVQTTHLTDFAILPGYNMFPKSTPVQVNGQVHFIITVCAPLNGHMDCNSSNSSTGFTNWAVNGAEFGTNGTGIVKPTDGYHATYTAPGKVPSPNTVAVSAQTPGRGATIVVSQVQIIGLTHLDANLNRAGATVCGLGKADVTEHFSLDLDIAGHTFSNVQSDKPVLMNLKADMGPMFSLQLKKNPEFFLPIDIKEIQDAPNGTKVVVLLGGSEDGDCSVYTIDGQFIVEDPGGTTVDLDMEIPYDASKFDSSGKQTEPATVPPDWTLTLTQ